MKRVDFFFDLNSPYSYLAATQVGDLGRRTGAAVGWRPLALGALFKAVGYEGPTHVPQAKRRWQHQDLVRWAAEYGVPFAFSPFFPANTIKAMRLVLVDDSRAEQVAMAGFRAMWVDALDLNDPGVLARIAEAGGLDVAAALAAIETHAVKQRLKANGDEAVARGMFGAPAMFVGDELHWGNDRLPFVEAALRLQPPA
jgi:2-hydroxychromene-2-carboxylate isomerase